MPPGIIWGQLPPFQRHTLSRFRNHPFLFCPFQYTKKCIHVHKIVVLFVSSINISFQMNREDTLKILSIRTVFIFFFEHLNLFF